MPSPSPQTSTTTTTQTSEPWEAQQGYLRDVFGNAQRLYYTWDPEYFPGDTVADLNPLQMGGVGSLAAIGMNDPTTQGAVGELGKTLGGDYLSAGNPYFSELSDKVTAQVLPAIQSQFAAGNRMGGGLAARASAEGLGDALGQLAYQNYADERTNMQRALAFSPQVQSMLFGDATAMLNAGDILQNQNQAEINSDIARWNFDQQLPAEKLAMYSQLVSGNYGGTGTGTTTQPYYTNPTADILSGALGLGALGSLFGLF